MADILSLSKARKAKARSAQEAKARENRIAFGRTKAEKQRDVAEKKRLDRASEGHLLPSKPESPDG